jgi:hypothetical protein
VAGHHVATAVLRGKAFLHGRKAGLSSKEPPWPPGNAPKNNHKHKQQQAQYTLILC